ncbi:hypothetical protein [Halobacteriovorax sp. DPLXC-1]|uniref:hypothetical protein n=1 Tax=Halobacteriovorax sp. DPLXC-1 TaxID=3110771 RepID=UPI002FF1FD28
MMKIIIYKCIFLILLNTPHAFGYKKPNNVTPDIVARMGDYVGNGGGVVEQDFTNALLNLPLYIEDCLLSLNCELTQQEEIDLKKILNIARLNSKDSEKLIFLSGKDSGKLFYTEGENRVRLAVTGLTNDGPIFINGDLLYEDIDNRDIPAINFGQIVALLIHETGHLTGLENHHYLDYLGAKVSSNMDLNKKRIDYFLSYNKQLSLEVVNFSSGYTFSTIQMYYLDKSFSLTPDFRKKISCEDESLFPVGMKLENIHWGKEYSISPDSSIVPFKGWITITCFDGRGMTWIEERVFEAHLQLSSNATYSIMKMIIE